MEANQAAQIVERSAELRFEKRTNDDGSCRFILQQLCRVARPVQAVDGRVFVAYGWEWTDVETADGA